MEPPQRDIVYKKTITAWDSAGAGLIVFDFSVAPYNLEFTPDSFIVKTITYISKSEQNANSGIPVITCDFSNDATSQDVIGGFSNAGSISHPNTIFPYKANKGGDLGQNCGFSIGLLTSQGVISPPSTTQSVWMVVLEFIKYGENNCL